MRKSDLISRTAKDTNCNVPHIRKIAESLKKNMREALLNGESVTIRGFGTYYIEITPTSERSSLRTKNKVTVPERKVLKFKPSPKFNFNIEATQVLDDE